MHMVTCKVCGKRFDRDKCEFVQISPRRYAHLACSQTEEEKLDQEEKDRKDLEEYIMQLLDETFVNARVRKQIKTYKEEYNYSYSGILKALKYFYEVKKNSTEKANGGIGIVPFVYKDAFNYYYSLWLAQQRNENKKIELYIPKVNEIRISRPVARLKRKKRFSFLDEKE